MIPAPPVTSPPRPPRSFRAAASLVLATCCAGVSVGAPEKPIGAASGSQWPVILIDETLDERRATLLSINEQSIVFIDEQQRQRAQPRKSVLAVVREEPRDEDEALRFGSRRAFPGMLTLVDGQRLTGDLMPSSAADAIRWVHPALGDVSWALERVWEFWRPASAQHLRESAPSADAPPSPSDTLFLTNGDSVRGFLVAVDEPVRLEIGDDETIDLPLELVAGARLSNTRERAAGQWVWLEDGSAVRVERLAMDSGGRATFSLVSGPSTSVRIDQIRAIAFDAGRCLPLAAIAPRATAPVPPRRYAPPIRIGRGSASAAPADVVPAPLGADDLRLPGPMSVTWDLPERASRLSVRAHLAPEAAPWGDCEIIIIVDEQERARRRLSAEQDAVAINLPIDGRSLSIRVEPGRYGPIRDWVILERPLVLVRESAGRQ